MNVDSRDALDQLLADWAASREADEKHTRRLSNEILSTVRDHASQLCSPSANKPSLIAEQRVPFVVPHAATSDAEWGAKLMVSGGSLLLIVILAGGLLWYNLTTTPNNNQQPARPIVASTGSTPPATIEASGYPTDASLGAAVLAAKRQLLAETNALFDNQLAWIADGEREFSFEVGDRAAPDNGEFMLVRVVVAQRASPDLPWSTTWQADVISRSEALVEVAPKQLDGSSLALWTYQMPDGEVAVDMDLALDQDTRMRSSSSTVLQVGQPTRVDCSTKDGVEHCVFQTVMPLDPSQI